MFVRTLTSRTESHWDTMVEQRALQLSHTFAVDEDNDMNALYTSQSSQSQLQQPSILTLPRPITDFRYAGYGQFLSRGPIPNEQYHFGEQSYSRGRGNSNIEDQRQSEGEWANHANNVFIISRGDHINEQDFYYAIDMLFQQLAQPKQKPKFRYIINRMRSKCSICFGKIKRQGETVCKTQCRHKFHKECLEKWTQKNPSCPLCRIKFT